MTLIQIQEELKQAMLSRSESKVSSLRLLVSEIKNWQIDKQTEATEEDIIQIIRSQVKKHKESAEAYKNGGRDDLAQKEIQEETLLNTYLPAQMPAGDLEKIVQETITQIQASGMGDFGKVMGAVMAKVKGEADGNEVSAVVKKLLS